MMTFSASFLSPASLSSFRARWSCRRRSSTSSSSSFSAALPRRLPPEDEAPDGRRSISERSSRRVTRRTTSCRPSYVRLAMFSAAAAACAAWKNSTKTGCAASIDCTGISIDRTSPNAAHVSRVSACTFVAYSSSFAVPLNKLSTMMATLSPASVFGGPSSEKRDRFDEPEKVVSPPRLPRPPSRYLSSSGDSERPPRPTSESRR
mmetsp:Transcript_26158/g.104649  ORF Transcript_26158/g.104649 Transcript_26158/m.104649 type:complete len:205 (-) Transcript_26158:892-1506(-)